MSDDPAELTWMAAIIQVMNETGKAMHYAEIADAIVERGLRHKIGATPASTVNTVITTNLNKLGGKSTFVRTGIGEYFLSSPKPAGASSRVLKKVASSALILQSSG